MHGLRNWMMFGCGGLVGAVVVAIVLSTSATPQAVAQPPKAGESHYQISSWAYPAAYEGGMRNGRSTVGSHGAYIVNTQSGEIYVVTEEGKPSPLGKVGGK